MACFKFLLIQGRFLPGGSNLLGIHWSIIDKNSRCQLAHGRLFSVGHLRCSSTLSFPLIRWHLRDAAVDQASELLEPLSRWAAIGTSTDLAWSSATRDSIVSALRATMQSFESAIWASWSFIKHDRTYSLHPRSQTPPGAHQHSICGQTSCT